MQSARCPAVNRRHRRQRWKRTSGAYDAFADQYAECPRGVRRGVFRYSTNTAGQCNALFHLSFDFVSTDMRLRVRGSSGRVLATSSPTPTYSSGFDYAAVLIAAVPHDGWYMLDIEDYSAVGGLLKDAPDTVCLKFAYSLRSTLFFIFVFNVRTSLNYLCS